jgi:hypothetical protein
MRWVEQVACMGEMTNAYNNSENLKGRNQLKDLGVNGKTILEWILGKYLDWIHVDQDRDQWRVLVNTVVNLRVPQNAEDIFCLN